MTYYVVRPWLPPSLCPWPYLVSRPTWDVGVYLRYCVSKPTPNQGIARDERILWQGGVSRLETVGWTCLLVNWMHSTYFLFTLTSAPCYH